MPSISERRLPPKAAAPFPGAQSAQHELPSVVGVGLWLRWRVTSDSAGRGLAGLDRGARRHDRERDRDGYADENRQSREYAAEELHVDHLWPPAMIALTLFTVQII